RIPAATLVCSIASLLGQGLFWAQAPEGGLEPGVLAPPPPPGPEGSAVEELARAVKALRLAQANVTSCAPCPVLSALECPAETDRWAEQLALVLPSLVVWALWGLQ
ncbi:unnamed protein product, partial [Prorocentrum cordatum]